MCSGCTLSVFFEMMLFLWVYEGFVKPVTGGHQTRGGLLVDGGQFVMWVAFFFAITFLLFEGCGVFRLHTPCFLRNEVISVGL